MATYSRPAIKVGTGYIDVVPRLTDLRQFRSDLRKRFRRLGEEGAHTFGSGFAKRVNASLFSATNKPKLRSSAQALGRYIGSAAGGQFITSFRGAVDKSLVAGAFARRQGRLFGESYGESAGRSARQSFGRDLRLWFTANQQANNAAARSLGTRLGRQVGDSFKDGLNARMAQVIASRSARTWGRNFGDSFGAAAARAATTAIRDGLRAGLALRGTGSIASAAGREFGAALATSAARTFSRVFGEHLSRLGLVAAVRAEFRRSKGQWEQLGRDAARWFAAAFKAHSALLLGTFRLPDSVARSMAGGFRRAGTRAGQAAGTSAGTTMEKTLLNYDFKSFAARMEDIGRSWTFFVTVPIVGGTAALGKFGIEMASVMQRGQLSFQMLGDTAAQASRRIAQLTAYADATAFSLEDVVDVVRSMRVVGLDFAEGFDILKGFSDLAAGVGATELEFRRIAYALKDIMTKTKLDAQDFRQLAEAGIDAWQYLSVAMGKTIPELKAMNKQGLLNPREAFLKLAEAVNSGTGELGKFRGMAKKLAGETFLGQITNAWNRFRSALGRGVIDYDAATGGISKLISQVEGILTGLGRAFEAILPVLVPTLTSIASGIRTLIDGFNDLDPLSQRFVVNLGLAVAAAGPLLMVLGLVGRSVRLFGESLSSVGGLLGTLGKHLKGGGGRLAAYGTAVGQVTSGLVKYGAAIAGFVLQVTGIRAGLSKLVVVAAAVGARLAIIPKTLKAFGTGVGNVLILLAGQLGIVHRHLKAVVVQSALWGSVAKVWRTLTAPVRALVAQLKLATVQSGILRGALLLVRGALIATGIGAIVVGVVALVSAFSQLSGESEKFSSGWSKFASILSRAWDGIYNAVLKPVFDWLGERLGEFADWLDQKGPAFWGFFQTLGQTAIRVWKTNLQPALSQLWTILGQVWDTLGALLKPVGDLISKLFNLGGGSESVTKDLGTFETILVNVAAAFDFVITNVSGVIKILAGLGRIVASLLKPFQALGQFITGDFRGALDSIKSMGTDWEQAFNQITDAVENGFTSWSSAQKRALSGMRGNMRSEMRAMVAESGSELDKLSAKWKENFDKLNRTGNLSKAEVQLNTKLQAILKNFAATGGNINGRWAKDWEKVRETSTSKMDKTTRKIFTSMKAILDEVVKRGREMRDSWGTTTGRITSRAEDRFGKVVDITKTDFGRAAAAVKDNSKKSEKDWKKALNEIGRALRAEDIDGKTGAVAEAVKKNFKGMEKGTKTSFQRVKDHADGSATYMIRTYWNGRMVPMFVRVKEAFPEAKISTPKPIRKARGGVIPGYRPGFDSVPALLTPGEGVLRPEVVRYLGKDTIEELNRLGRAGLLQQFARGGIVQPDTGGFWESVTGFIKGAAGSLGDWLSNLKKWFYDQVLGAFRNIMAPAMSGIRSRTNSGPLGTAMKFGAGAGYNGALAWLKANKHLFGGDASAVVKVARSQLGQGDRGGVDNNRNKYNGFNGEPWCADFISWVVGEARASRPYWGHGGFRAAPAVITWLNSARRTGSVIPRGQARPGDLAVYGTSRHLNLIEKPLGGVMQTIGGNEGPLVRRSRRGGQSHILRPLWGRYAEGGLVPRQMFDATNTHVLKAWEALKLAGIPMYARGGVVRSPQLAMVGESGPELVLPLNEPRRLLALVAEYVTPLLPRVSESGLGSFVRVGESIGDELITGLKSKEFRLGEAVEDLVTTLVGKAVYTIPPGEQRLTKAARPMEVPQFDPAQVQAAAETVRPRQRAEQPRQPSAGHQITINAAPDVPTEKTLLRTLAYAEALYN